MNLEKLEFVYPYRNAKQKWVVKEKVRTRWLCEIVDGQFAGIKAEFDGSHIRRMVHVQKILKDLPIGKVSKKSENRSNRGRAWKDKGVQKAPTAIH